MVKIFRQVGRDTLPFFVRDLLGDGRKRPFKGTHGRRRPQHCYRTGIVLYDNFIASAYMIQ